MRTSHVLLSLLLALLAGCATTMDAAAPAIPPGAEATTRTEANGDVVTEYRVGGALAMVKVQPANGPTWYLVDSDGDGRLDRTSGEARDAPVYFKLYSW